MQKIEKIAGSVYGAAGVRYSEESEKKIRRFVRLGYGKLPICMAKTQYSLSGDPSLKGRPAGFTITVRDVRLSAGAGFLYCICGNVLTMPGMPARPKAVDYELDDAGRVTGLF